MTAKVWENSKQLLVICLWLIVVFHSISCSSAKLLGMFEKRHFFIWKHVKYALILKIIVTVKKYHGNSRNLQFFLILISMFEFRS